ncbi:hypothetical protein TYRP_007239 [Tyrophagus putrescentiae]|nr:hypothetical protein TYRP_007239 [Tyrophagus putrescentiae]
MHLLNDCFLWFLDHLNSVQVSLILLQLQKVLAIIIWYSERTHSLTLLKNINDSLCRDVVQRWIGIEESGFAGLATWTYVFVCFFGINALSMKNGLLIGLSLWWTSSLR